MCLAIPGKVIELDKEQRLAVVDYDAEQRQASTALVPETKIGDYVLVQAKMIVQTVPEAEARAALDMIAGSGEGKDA